MRRRQLHGVFLFDYVLPMHQRLVFLEDSTYSMALLYRLIKMPASLVPLVNQKIALTNGALSGTYSFEACSVGTASPCYLGDQRVEHGQSIKAYTSSSVPSGSVCQEINRTCNNGSLSGTGSFTSCSVNAPSSCLFNSTQIPHGGSVRAYATSSVAFGQTCSFEIELAAMES